MLLKKEYNPPLEKGENLSPPFEINAIWQVKRGELRE